MNGSSCVAALALRAGALGAVLRLALSQVAALDGLGVDEAACLLILDVLAPDLEGLVRVGDVVVHLQRSNSITSSSHSVLRVYVSERFEVPRVSLSRPLRSWSTLWQLGLRSAEVLGAQGGLGKGPSHLYALSESRLLT